jgi:hypothetical protein
LQTIKFTTFIYRDKSSFKNVVLLMDNELWITIKLIDTSTMDKNYDKCTKKSFDGLWTTNYKWRTTIPPMDTIALGQLWHKLNYFQLCWKFPKKFQPFLLKISKTHSRCQSILNQGPIWPNQLFYIHMTTNTMKYLKNSNEFY